MLNKKRTQTLGFVKIKLGIQVSVFIVQAILTLTKPSKGQDEHILLCEEWWFGLNFLSMKYTFNYDS